MSRENDTQDVDRYGFGPGVGEYFDGVIGWRSEVDYWRFLRGTAAEDPEVLSRINGVAGRYGMEEK